MDLTSYLLQNLYLHIFVVVVLYERVSYRHRDLGVVGRVQPGVVVVVVVGEDAVGPGDVVVVVVEVVHGEVGDVSVERVVGHGAAWRGHVGGGGEGREGGVVVDGEVRLGGERGAGVDGGGKSPGRSKRRRHRSLVHLG